MSATGRPPDVATVGEAMVFPGDCDGLPDHSQLEAMMRSAPAGR